MSTPLVHSDPDALDAADPLRRFRMYFAHHDGGLNYLDGNSLGRLPHATRDLLHAAIDHEWGERLIRSWNEGWFDLPVRIGGKIAHLVGAKPDEVVVADSTSVNLFKLVVGALRANRGNGRTRILTDDLNFPSDLYVLQGACDLLGGFSVEVIPSPDGIHGPIEAIMAQLDERVALVTLSHTCFKSAYLYEMAAVNAAAHNAGALTLWDLSHSVGAVPVTLNASDADLAVGCTYKYLNGGPGAPAFLYVRKDLQERIANPVTGWMAQENLFNFDNDYQRAVGMRAYLTGTWPVLSMAAIEPGVDLLLSAGMENLRAKSLMLSDYLIALWQEHLEPLGYSLKSPLAGDRRGSHISLGHQDGWRIDQALIHRLNTLPDFRQPDNIRLGIAPLYNSFSDIYAAAHALKRIEEEGLQSTFVADGAVVT